MKTAQQNIEIQHSIEIWKREGGESFTRRVSLGPCPHCRGYELIVSDVEVQGTVPTNYPEAVHCGQCGASGPWSQSEEGAIVAWNNTTGVGTNYLSEWEVVSTIPETDSHAAF